MADGINIDTLEIEVEASSESAVEKLNALTEALKDLQVATKQKFGNIFKQIDGIGDSASAAQKKVHEKKEILNRATGKASRPVEFDTAKAVKGIKSLDKEISNTEKNIARLRAQIEAIESAKVTTENPSAELFSGFDSQIEKAKEALKEQSDVLSALQSQQKSLRDSLREGMASMGVGGNFDQVGEDVEELADKMQGLASTAKETAQSLDLRKTLRDSLYGDIKKRTDAIRDSLADAKERFGEFSDFINDEPGVEGLEAAQDYAKKIREQFKAATYAAKEAKQELAQYSALNQPISDSQISAFVKAQNAVDALKEKYEKLKSEFNDLPELPDFSKSKTSIASSVKDFQEIQNAASEAKKQIDDIGKASVEAPDIKALQKELDSLKGAGMDQLKKMLASAELQAVKTDGKLAAMRRTLDGLKDTPGFEAVENDLQAFADRAGHTKLYIEDFRKAIELISDYKPDLSMEGAAEEIQAVREQVKRLIDEYKEANNASKVAGETVKNSMAELKATAKSTKANKPTEKFDFFKDVKGVLDTSFGKGIGGIIPKGADSSIKALTGAFEGLTNSALGFAKAHPVVGGALLAVGVAVKGIVGQMRKLASSAFSAAKKGFELLASGARKLAASIKDLLKSGIGNLGKGIVGIGKSVTSGITRPFRDALASFQKWKSAIGRVAFYRLVREAIKQVTDGFKTGMENLYQYSLLVGTEFAPAMDRLATSSLYLKNSLGAMAAPLIQALAPAIDFIIDKFVALFNIIGKVFAALTGKSVYTQAKKHAVEYGEAAKDASKATKDFLLGIDELNVINDNAGSAGGAMDDFGSMFEEVEVPNEISDWAAKVREAIKNGEWRQVGEIVADKLNEIVDSWDSYAWGQRLGELINNGLNVAYGFLTTFDFEELGRKVADGINGIFDTVDWDLLGRTFAAGWNGLFDFIYGFATKLDWRGIGSSIADAINGAIDEFNFERAAQAISKLVTGIFTTFKTTLRETHWYTLGAELANFINNIDWYGIIYSSLTTITAALDALRMGIDGFLSGWDWRDMALKISTAINDAFNSISWGSLGKSIGNGIKTALAFVSETLDGIGWRDIGNKIGQFIIGLDWVGILAGLANVIVSGINAAIKTVSGLISTIQPHIKDWARDLGNKFMEAIRKIEWADAGKALSDGIEAALDFMIEFMQTVDWDEVGQHIAEFLENIDWDTLLTKWGQLLGEIMNAKMKVLDVSGILEVGANIVKGLLSGILTEFDAGGGITGWIKRHLFDAFIGAIKWLFGIHPPSTVMAEIGGFLVAGLLQGIQDTISDVVGFFEDIWNGILGTFETIGALIVSVTTGDWQTVRDIITGAWESSRTATDENLSKIQATTSEKFGLIETDALDKFGKTKAHALDCWSGIKTDTDDKLSQIRNKAKTEFESIETESAQKFKATKKNITDAWEGARNSTDTNLPSISQTASTHFKKIHDDSSSTFQEVKRIVKDSWDDVERNTKTSWQNNEKTVGDKMKEIKKDIENPFTGTDGLVEKARNWGRDIIENLSSGMEGKRHRLDTATRNVARDISSYLHFSEPDIGPLSDFHTYMPDMLQLMAKGIKDNSHLAVNAASDLADSMSRVFRDIEPVQPQYTVRQNPYTTMPDAFAQAQSAGASISNYNSTTTNVSNDNGDVIAALKAGFQALIETINSQDYSTHLDGKTLMQSVERAQRQRGVNIMEGGVLG